jgi:2,4-didehydro-3-deoxy-L-rhamnonate hydrolase
MFALGTFADGGDAFAGLVVDDRVVDLRTALGSDINTAALLADWPDSLERLRQLAECDLGRAMPLSALRPLPPISPARQVFCAGANYITHLREMAYTGARGAPGESRPDEEVKAEAEIAVQNFLAAKAPPFVFTVQSSALSGAHDDVVLWGPGSAHDWELELAIVIGRAARDVTPGEAMGHVAGYTIANDISTRDVMFRPNFPLSDFLMSKGRPTFKPTGPYLVPREFVEDYRQLRIRLKVNGEVMQDEAVADIMFGVEELVSYTSSVTPLEPGDLLLTGSPAGNAGIHGNRWLRPGDVIESEITGLGSQRNTCVPDPRHRN